MEPFKLSLFHIMAPGGKGSSMAGSTVDDNSNIYSPSLTVKVMQIKAMRGYFSPIKLGKVGWFITILMRIAENI
jgi:hypothetical protein